MMTAAMAQSVRSLMMLSRPGMAIASVFLAILILPSEAFAEPPAQAETPVEDAVEPTPEPAPAPVPSGPYPYVLAIINGGVVTNVAALSYDNDYSAFWTAMQAQNDEVRRVPVGSAGVGWIVLPDGSLGPEPPPTPPDQLPQPADGEGEWRRTGPADPSPTQPREYPYVLAIINGGVVTNVAALSYDNDYSAFWAAMRAQNDQVLRVRRAGIGWRLMPDGSLAPPAPRPGMVWDGSEWRDPGTEEVERPTDVRGWALDRSEPIIADFYAGVYGRLLVPEDAVDEDSTTAEIAERSIVMIESYGDTVPFLARFDGLTQLRERLERELDAALAAREQTTGEPVSEEVAEGFRGAARRLAASFLSLFGMDSTAWIRGLA